MDGTLSVYYGLKNFSSLNKRDHKTKERKICGTFLVQLGRCGSHKEREARCGGSKVQQVDHCIVTNISDDQS